MASTGIYPEYPDLDGSVALVTGGSRGIGAETAVALAANGASVAIAGRDKQALDDTRGRIRSVARTGRSVEAFAADCTSEAQVTRLKEDVMASIGSPDIVIVFAGGNGMPVATADETVDHWREVLDSELTSCFLTVSAFLDGMIEHKKGTIVTMSSAAARQAGRSSAAYTAGKAGVIAFSRHIAGEYAGDGIRVNCVAPSAIENDRMRKWMSEAERDALGDSFPLGRIGQPFDVACATLFLASSASSWITGETLDISGGKVML